MSLDNLVGRSLERIEPDPATIKRLLAAAARNIHDAGVEAISNENRFDSAYKAILQMANAALQSRGYRTPTSKPGHHMTMLQTLPLTLGLDNTSVIVMDALRQQRHVVDYSGDVVSPASVKECIAQAPNNRHNQYLKQSCDSQAPLIYFYAVAEGVYKAIFPCFIERIYPEEMTCRVSVASEFGTFMENPQLRDSEAWRIERRYALRETKARLHQAAFREQVINAYGSRCAMTGLPVRQLLDAAHIVPDSHALGVAHVNNGICLSRIHHRAFDANLIGISADYRLHVSQRLMDEKDGVILESGLKALHGTELNRPVERKNWPNQELLDLRFEEFKRWT